MTNKIEDLTLYMKKIENLIHHDKAVLKKVSLKHPELLDLLLNILNPLMENLFNKKQLIHFQKLAKLRLSYLKVEKKT